MRDISKIILNLNLVKIYHIYRKSYMTWILILYNGYNLDIIQFMQKKKRAEIFTTIKKKTR